MTKKKGKVSSAKKEPDWYSVTYMQPIRRYKGKLLVDSSPWARFCCTLSDATLCDDGKRLVLRGTHKGRSVRLEVEHE